MRGYIAVRVRTVNDMEIYANLCKLTARQKNNVHSARLGRIQVDSSS